MLISILTIIEFTWIRFGNFFQKHLEFVQLFKREFDSSTVGSTKSRHIESQSREKMRRGTCDTISVQHYTYATKVLVKVIAKRVHASLFSSHSITKVMIGPLSFSLDFSTTYEARVRRDVRTGRLIIYRAKPAATTTWDAGHA